MSSAICFTLEPSKLLLSGNGLSKHFNVNKSNVLRKRGLMHNYARSVDQSQPAVCTD